MPLDPRAARFLDMASAGRGGAGPAGQGPRDVAARRAGLATLMGFARAEALAPPGRDGDVAGVPVRHYAPADVPPEAVLPGLVFLHGGGLVAGGLDTHDTVARALAAASACRVVAVGYRLAPEHPFPAALDDVAAVVVRLWGEARRHGIDPARVGILGESGGGTLATVVVHDAVAAGRPPALLALLCPVLDFAAESASRAAYADGYLIDRDTLEADLADYLPAGVDRADPRVSPLRLESLAGFPPTILHTAEYDPLVDEGDAFAARLAAAGVAVTHHRHTGQLHNFHALGGVVPYGRTALTAVGREIGAALRGL